MSQKTFQNKKKITQAHIPNIKSMTEKTFITTYFFAPLISSYKTFVKPRFCCFSQFSHVFRLALTFS